MRVVIVSDPKNPSRQGTVEEIEDGYARLMIRDGLARKADVDTQSAGAQEPGPGGPQILSMPRQRRIRERDEPQ